MAKSNYHVTPKEDDWQVKKAGANRASVIVQTQKEAEKIAKEFASNRGGGEVRIHGRDGKIRDSDTVSPANDPNPPKDNKY